MWSNGSKRSSDGLNETHDSYLGPAIGLALAIVAWTWPLSASETAEAQDITTSTIAGSVVGQGGAEVDGAEVRVVNRANGVAAQVAVRHGRFVAPALESGGPYAVEVRAIGFDPEVRDSLYLTLGQRLELEFQLQPSAVELPEVSVSGEPGVNRLSAPASGVTIVSDSLLRRLPTLNRDIYDFVTLNPHVSTPLAGTISGAGVNPRYNSFQIDGVTEQAVHGRAPAGVTGGGKPITLEAVKEYQVLVAPYDVALGNFSGTLVNAVTRSGTNRFMGSAFVFARSEKLARNVPFLRDAPYNRAQYGFSASGPIVRDRAHFFITMELQHLSLPAGGPYIGQSDAIAPVPADADAIARFQQILRSFGLDPGSSGPVSLGNPLTNLFARIDVAIPGWNSRLVIRHNHDRGDVDLFSRGAESTGDPSVFPLSSFGYTQVAKTDVTAVQLHTVFHSGAANEVIAGYYNGPFYAMPNARAPLAQVQVPGVDPGTTATLQAGTDPVAETFRLSQYSFELTDNLRLPLGASHRLTVGARAEVSGTSRNDVAGAYGSWEFASLDSLAAKEPFRYQVSRDFGGGQPSVTAAQFSLYAGDSWRPAAQLAVLLGVRADLPIINGQPTYAPSVDSVFGRRTDAMPATVILWSPRLGFEWEPGRLDRLRGGIGLFTARAPLAWWLYPRAQYGEGVRTLRCGILPSDAGPPPQFSPDFNAPPTTCANGVGFNTDQGGPVTLLDPSLRYPQVLRASLTYERVLPGGITATLEGIYTRSRHDVVFLNRALSGPTGTDPHSRVLYGSIDGSGRATPAFVSPRFPEVQEVVDQAQNRSYDLSIQFGRSLGNGLGVSVAYTRSWTRDLETALDVFTSDNWALRPVSGRVDQLGLSVSDLDQPHRIVAAMAWSAPWRRWRTGVSLFYVGHSGAPFTFIAGADTRNRATGDLNADGSNRNDPLYIPRDARDASEIVFDGTPAEVARQQASLEALITTMPCLARQRGRIMERNSCRAPWVHSLGLALQQLIPAGRRHPLEVQLQLFNLLNFLHAGWGLVQTPNPALLRHVGQLTGSGAPGTPVFRMDPGYTLYDPNSIDSYYQLQISARVSY